ncbi:MAG: hypothetical protein ACFFG0_36240, partial [Candidatus Thorarchaeota archaeon]
RNNALDNEIGIYLVESSGN